MKTILLIEDNEDVRENTAEILELSHFRVITAGNGKEGIEKVREHKPDLIICDIMMPELDGYGVLHVLSKDPDTATIPFIFLSAKSERTEVRKGMNLGADDYLTKPFDDMELLQAVESRLNKHEALMSAFSRDLEGLNEFYQQARGMEELQHLSEEIRPRRFKKKMAVYDEGDLPIYLYFINQGRVKTFKTNAEGKEFVIHIYKEGEFFGYQALLEEKEHTESAAALEDCEIAMIPRQDFFDLLHRNRDLSTRFIKMLSNELHEQEERLIELAYNSVRKRTADALVMLNDKYADEDGNPLEMPVSRDNLAAIVGTAKETVIRVLSDFKDEGLIETRASNIRILNLDKLKRTLN